MRKIKKIQNSLSKNIKILEDKSMNKNKFKAITSSCENTKMLNVVQF